MKPAGLRSPNPFIRPKKKSGSQKLGLNHDDVDVSYNHRQADEDNRKALTSLRLQLIQAEGEGKYSKARKLRRAINKELEQGLYLTHSWCYGCQNVLHNCQC